MQDHMNQIIKPRSEIFYQRVLENVLQGKHKKLACGITDITTNTLHAEIKAWPKWKHAIGQLLVYDAFDNKNSLHVYLFNKYPIKKKDMAIKVFQKYNIHPYEFKEDIDSDKLEVFDFIKNKCIFKDYFPY